MYKLHTRCRACGFGPQTLAGGVKLQQGHEQLVPVFDLGVQPLANDFCAAEEERAGYAPLAVLYCPNCSLGQLSVTVRPEILYSRYLYVTSPSRTMREHFAALQATLGNCESLLEIGSNDGALLKHFAASGVRVLGIDPAANLCELARAQGIPALAALFDRESAECALCKHGVFDVILARHVFCHVDNWREFIDHLVIPSHKSTLFAIEVPYAQDMLEKGEFDTIYHEHLSYLTVKSVEALLVDSPLKLHRIVRFPIHGGAILLLLRRKDWNGPAHESVERFRAGENITEETWRNLERQRVEAISQLWEFLERAGKNKQRVVGLGASAKSTVWINAAHFTRREIEFITDTTPQKLYKTCPGSDIPIVDEGAILRELPDYVICFAWNFRDYVLEHNALARSKGVKFVFPVPKFDVV